MESESCENLFVNLLGFIPSVYDYYSNHSVDVFLNVSNSEGIPVSIMEAENCGIPIIATAVGGNPEIVSADCGVLLSANPTSHEIAEALFSTVQNPDTHLELRKGAHNMWKQNFNVHTNSKEFIRMVDNLIKTSE